MGCNQKYFSTEHFVCNSWFVFHNTQHPPTQAYQSTLLILSVVGLTFSSAVTQWSRSTVQFNDLTSSHGERSWFHSIGSRLRLRLTTAAKASVMPWTSHVQDHGQHDAPSCTSLVIFTGPPKALA